MGERCLQLALQKAFNTLKQVTNDWVLINKDCEPCIVFLANMLEQFECCQNTSIRNLPIHTVCPDLHDKLIFKITTELENKIQALQNKLNEYKECHSKISQQYHNVKQIYKTYSSSELNIDLMTDTPATHPSLAQMMEFLFDIEHLFYNQYHGKKYILDEMILSNNITSDNLIDQWSSEHSILSDKITDYLCYITYFMEKT